MYASDHRRDEYICIVIIIILTVLRRTIFSHSDRRRDPSSCMIIIIVMPVQQWLKLYTKTRPRVIGKIPLIKWTIFKLPRLIIQIYRSITVARYQTFCLSV